MRQPRRITANRCPHTEFAVALRGRRLRYRCRNHGCRRRWTETVPPAARLAA